ncbi:YopT-type cysteine protease domain-containing protein [Bradyrhizobium liaoningense]
MDFSCFGYHPDLESRLTFQEKWVLEPSAEETRYRFGTSSCIDKIVNELAQDPSVHLVSLKFVQPGAGTHTIATATSNGTTILSDPNYGEFTVPSDRVGGLFKSLAERYRSYG